MDPSTSPPRRATIEDVANAAGVSVATVSRALRGLPNVATSTRNRIIEVARVLDYKPDPAASRLAVGRTKTVTVAVPTLNGWYFSTVVAGVEAVCAEAGYDVLVVGVTSATDRTRLLDGNSHIERRTDGLVLVDIAVSEEESVSLGARGLSIATVGSGCGRHPSVMIDDVAVGDLAATHLLELGHTHIGVIGAQRPDPMSFEVPILRHRGFESRLRRAGVTLDPDLVVGGNFGVDGGHEAMQQLLDRGSPPTAVFALSDEMAFGALMALDERGLRAGQDVSLIGVDDHEFARVVELTTIRQDVADHGAHAARALITMMAGEPPDVLHRRQPIELIRRATTAPRRTHATGATHPVTPEATPAATSAATPAVTHRASAGHNLRAAP